MTGYRSKKHHPSYVAVILLPNDYVISMKYNELGHIVMDVLGFKLPRHLYSMHGCIDYYFWVKDCLIWGMYLARYHQ